MLWTNNLSQAYFFMFMLGLTFPGKNIIWYNYALEITADEWRNTVVNSVFAIEVSTIIWIALYYQTVSNSWLYIQIVAAILTFSLLLLVTFGFAESPKYLYTKSKFNEARASLKWIGYLNGTEFDDNFLFDTELQHIREHALNQELPSNDQSQEISHLHDLTTTLNTSQDSLL